MPASRQATGVGFPCAIDTSIWRSSVTICSALNLFFGMTQAPFQAHSLTTLGSKKPGQVTNLPKGLVKALSQPILYSPASGGRLGHGVDATLLPAICTALLALYHQKKLYPSQET